MIRPSNLDRRSRCPGSERLEEGLPNEESAEAKEGTLLHYYLAHSEFVRDILSPNLRELLSRTEELLKQANETIERSLKQ